MKTRPLDPARARVYVEKARRFADAADLGMRHGQWDPAVSAASHALISAVDAVCVRRLGRRSASDDHAEAAALLGEVPGLPADQRRTVVKHLTAVLALKHGAEYEDRLVEEAEARRAMQALARALPVLLRWAGEDAGSRA